MTYYKGDLQPVIVRAAAAGVHFGLLEGYEGQVVWLRDAVRLWRWKANAGVALSAVAATGIDYSASKLDALVEKQIILDACEIISCSKECEASVRAYQWA